MENTKNEHERTKYNQLIVQKEEQLDELTNNKRKITEAIQNLEEDLHRGFQTVAMLNDEAARFGNTENHQLQRYNEEQERAFHQLLRESNEQIVLAYKKETKKMDEEREMLYKKRSDIPWD
ncbi:hypothetical protein [Enterococcus wangshanyuanii]|uniref:Cingulin n=1 Tax=Enterococcus wangshanyuanii TaxID=2005703 RepID=A0ABQ1PII4_9ENTE|nr:hypothetical protein [Enterococcus wangshanyuanii]GGC97728.1 hypothetical protein GCM10011573_29050 [Enterococcus wangshanyuanii]